MIDPETHLYGEIDDLQGEIAEYRRALDKIMLVLTMGNTIREREAFKIAKKALFRRTNG
jgi:hypothetical protein